jgi:hypothetical protein
MQTTGLFKGEGHLPLFKRCVLGAKRYNDATRSLSPFGRELV